MNLKVYTFFFSVIIAFSLILQSCNWDDDDAFDNGHSYYASLDGIWHVVNTYSRAMADSTNPDLDTSYYETTENFGFNNLYIQFNQDGTFKQLRGFNEATICFSGFTSDSGIYTIDKNGVIYMKYDVSSRSVIFYTRLLNKDSNDEVNLVVVEKDNSNKEIDSLCLHYVRGANYQQASYLGCWKLWAVSECLNNKHQADGTSKDSPYKGSYFRFTDDGVFKIYKQDGDSLVFGGSLSDYGTYSVCDSGWVTLSFADNTTLIEGIHSLDTQRMTFMTVDRSTGKYIFSSFEVCNDPNYTEPSLEGLWQCSSSDGSYYDFSNNYFKFYSNNTFERMIGLDTKNIANLNSYDDKGPQKGKYTYYNDTLTLVSDISDCPGTWTYKCDLTSSTFTLLGTAPDNSDYTVEGEKLTETDCKIYDRIMDFSIINRKWKCSSCQFLATNSNEKVDAMEDFGMSDYTITFNAGTAEESGSSVTKRQVKWYFYSSSYITFFFSDWDESTQSYGTAYRSQRMVEKLSEELFIIHYFDSDKKGTVYLQFVPATD